MKKAGKIIAVSIFALVLILLFSAFAYAKPFTDVLRDSLVRINNFFAQENYKPYAKTIDFFIFSLVFISIYLIGVRYAFKEVKRPEQAIAIVLGFTTAFLFVLRDYSITSLLPEIGTPSISTPTFLGGVSKSAGDFFKSFGGSFKGIEFQPQEVPASVKMLGEVPPVVGPTPATGAPSTPTPAPATTAEEQKRQAEEAAARQKAEEEAARNRAAVG